VSGIDQIARQVLHAAVDDPPRPVTVAEIRDRVTRRRRRGVIAGVAALAVAAAAVIAVTTTGPGTGIRPGLTLAQPGNHTVELAGAVPLTQPEAAAAGATVAQRLRFLRIPGSVAVTGLRLTVHADIPARLLPALTAIGQVQFRPVLSIQPQPAGTLCFSPAANPFTACDGHGHRYRLGPLVVSSADLISVHVVRGPAGSWAIDLGFSAAGAQRLDSGTGRITTLKPPGNELAISVNGVVVSSLAVLARFTGGSTQIAGDFTHAQATLLAASITGRPLPVQLKVLPSGS
jgi:preprotein translocase subunit SecD